MANVQVNRNTMTQIADAIRQKLNTTDTFKPSEMATAIANIEEPQQDDFKKAGKIFTTALTSNPFTITAYDQNTDRQLLEQAFYYTGETNYTNILKNLVSIAFSAIGLKAPSSMNQFFRGLPEIKTIDLVGLDISEVTTMLNMCYGDTKLETFKFGSVSNDIVTNINYIFYDCEKLSSLDQGNFDISNISTAQYAFYRCYVLPGISFINDKTYSNLIDTKYMFQECNLPENVILEGIDLTSEANIDLRQTLYKCPGVKTITIKDVTIPNSSKIDIGYFITECSNLNEITLNNVIINGIINSGYSYQNNLKTISFVNTEFLNDSNNCSYLLSNYTSSSSYHINLQTVNFVNSEFHGNYDGFFSGCKGLTSVNFTNTKLKIKSARGMFSYCINLVNIDFNDSLDIESNEAYLFLNTFENCSSLESVDFGSGKIISTNSSSEVFREMFNGCTNLTAVDFSDIELSIQYAYRMFANVTSLTTVLFGEDTVINKGSYMFDGCTSLTTIDLSNVIINNTDNLFYNATALTTITLKDNSVFESANAMFYNCSSLVNISFNNITFKNEIRNMFYGCNSLISIDLSNTIFSNIEINYYAISMFANCTSLQSVILPASFNYIYSSQYYERATFKNCTSLQSLTLLSITPPVSVGGSPGYIFSTTYGEYNEGMKIYVPQGCGQTYKEDANQSMYADIIYELT